jgi:hypothetical protein
MRSIDSKVDVMESASPGQLILTGVPGTEPIGTAALFDGCSRVGSLSSGETLKAVTAAEAIDDPRPEHD